MKGLIVYDSYYGNTKLVAETIAEQLRVEGHEVEVRSVREKNRVPPQGDLLFLGSPVRMGSTTRRVKRYVEKLDKDAWAGKPLVVFTTILELPPDAPAEREESREKYDIAAGRKLVEYARSKGLNALDHHLWVDVKDKKGPVVEDGREQTRRFVSDTLRGLDG